MGRLLFSILLLSAAMTLFGDITLESQINQTGSQIQFSGESAIINSQSDIYAVYCRNIGNIGILELALSPGYGVPFFTYTIDTLYTETPDVIEKVLPVIKLLNDGNLFIIYNKLISGNRLVLHKAFYNTVQNTFTISVLTNEISSAPVISKDPNDLNVYYATSFREKASDYVYLADRMRSVMPEQFNVKLYGTSQFRGDVHSNENIVIAAGSRPTFDGFTSAHNRIRYDNGQPADLNNTNIFADGGKEYVKKKHLPDTADKLINIASTPFDSTADIVYVKIDGSTYQSMYANISETQVQIPVYSWFPADDAQARDIISSGRNWYEDAHVIWTNTVTKYDTTWTPGPSGIAENSKFWLNTTLWIEGTITGVQSWGSSKDIYITNDILYSSTFPGYHPDGYNPNYDDYSEQINTEDYFFLISESSIYIKYKHRDPFQNNILRADNCQNTILYGVFAAIGIGDTESDPYEWYNASKFTYEYMLPHYGLKDFYSISPATQNDTLYTDVIYHRYIIADPETVPDSLKMYCLNNPTNFVTATGTGIGSISAKDVNPGYHNSYPNADVNYTPPMIAYDFPGYNPVGPENIQDLNFQRGSLAMFGSLIVRRIGYFYISGGDINRHQGAEWDFENHLYGTTTSPAGYDCRYLFYDSRLKSLDLPEIPELNNISFARLSLMNDSLNFESDFAQTASDNNTGLCFYDYDDSLSIFVSQRTENGESLSAFDFFYSLSDGDTLQYVKLEPNTIEMDLLDVDINEGITYFLFHDNINSENIVYNFYPDSNQLTEIYRINSATEVCDLDFLVDNRITIAQFENHSNPDIAIYTEESDVTPLLYWDSAFSADAQAPVSSIYYDAFGGNFIFMCFQTNENNGWGNLYCGIGDFDVIGTKDDVLPVEQFRISNYPNPFNPETNIAYSIPEDADVEINIYNIKGQKVKTLLNERVLKGSHNVIWSGVDDNNTPVGSGVYFYKLKADNRTISVNKCVLIK